MGFQLADIENNIGICYGRDDIKAFYGFPLGEIERLRGNICIEAYAQILCGIVHSADTVKSVHALCRIDAAGAFRHGRLYTCFIQEKKKRAELVMLKSFQVEGVELIEIVKVKNGVLMTAGVSRLKKWGVCYKQAK